MIHPAEPTEDLSTALLTVTQFGLVGLSVFQTAPNLSSPYCFISSNLFNKLFQYLISRSTLLCSTEINCNLVWLTQILSKKANIILFILIQACAAHIPPGFFSCLSINRKRQLYKLAFLVSEKARYPCKYSHS